ncbi:MAG: hypothetical protein CVU65_05640 [Deltaproteobacteria bacterium HGW-Deltaproteobacteria-22]|nr:MAG: hypothetical protein CVU65_05640 [Deltaproteobacteria bacterium HGW-Deltaproteobacteria-22]
MTDLRSPVKWTAWASLSATFFMMCVVRAWWTMFVLFGLALTMVLIFGKNRYCSSVCPLGALQDSTGDNAAARRHFAAAPWLKYLMVPLFWGVTIYTTFTFIDSPNVLWVWMLRIMISMFFLAMVTQMYLGKRFFCVHLCPLRHPLLEPARKSRKLLKGRGRPA